MKTNQTIATLSFCLLSSLVYFTDAAASTIAYNPQNPAIFSGVNPANETALMTTVVQPKNPNLASTSQALTASTLVEQSILSQISQNIISTIFTSKDTDHGSFQIGNGDTLSYVNALGVITVTINDATGTTTLTF